MTRRTQIAARLTAVVAAGDGSLNDFDACRVELRALLAVVRAAEAVNRADDDGAGTTMPLEFWRPMKKLSDALSRLRRASREG
jgi:hypothetical protein